MEDNEKKTQAKKCPNKGTDACPKKKKSTTIVIGASGNTTQGIALTKNASSDNISQDDLIISEQIIKNITFCLEETGVKISEIENLANVKAGYFSRVKSGAIKAPSMVFLRAASKCLKVTIDQLVNEDLTELKGVKKYAYNFVQKVTKDTLDSSICWEYFGNTEGVVKEICKSLEKEHNAPFKQRGVFFFNMGSSATCYIVRADRAFREGEEDNLHIKEIWIKDKSGLNRFVSSTNGEDYSKWLDELFDVVYDSMSGVRVTPEMKSAIDAYMLPNGVMFE